LPHLAALAEVELAQPLVSPVAVVGQLACAVDAAEVLNTFQLPDLSRGPRHQLSGRCVWGPKAISERFMLTTDDGQLFCLDPDGKLLWQAALPYGPLAGTPLPVGNHLVLAAVSGVVWRIEAASGQQVGKVEVGQPLGSGPVLLGDRLLVGGHDGSLLEVKQP
jgi:outer membrane protein assembly factor BamB